MATFLMVNSAPAPARSPARPPDPLPLRRRLRRVALLAVVLAVAALAWFWRPLADRAEAGAAYGARIGCSCRFIAGRALGDCRKDFAPGMGLVMLSEDAEAKRVTATVPLLARDGATFRQGQGCVPDRWED